MWDALLTAIALVFVIEGIMPFLSPSAAREAYLRISQLNDRALRLGGLASMATGVVMLYFFVN